MTSDSSTDTSIFTEEDEALLNVDTRHKIVNFLNRVVEEYDLTADEQEVVAHAIASYVEGYRNLGTATVLAGILTEEGYVFTDEMPNPIPENQKNTRESALNLIKELRNVGLTTNDINAITEEMKALGEAARKLGMGQALVMIDTKD